MPIFCPIVCRERPPNSKTGKKPAFDSRLYSAFVTMVKEKFPLTSSKEIKEKVHSVQKFVINGEKKL